MSSGSNDSGPNGLKVKGKKRISRRFFLKPQPGIPYALLQNPPLLQVGSSVFGRTK
jgi:hypothetical protein